MDPALSLPSSPVQTARHNSQALSMDLKIHTFPKAAKSEILEKNEKNTNLTETENSVNFINTASLFNDMPTDENDGGYVNLKKWEQIEIKRKLDSRGRFHAGEKYIDTDIRVFVSNEDMEPEKCKHYLLFPEPTFKEIRKSRIKDQAGELLKVQTSGDVWTGASNKNKFFKFFVRK